MKRNRSGLVAHVGSRPSAVQLALIDRVVMLTHQLGLLDRKRAAGHFTDHDCRTYLAWSGAQSRLLRQLGMQAAPERAPTLAEYVRAQASA